MNIAPLRTAVQQYMERDAALNGLLTRDPNDSTVPAVLRGNQNAKQPVYPCVTYRLSKADPDARFRPTPVEGGGESKIVDFFLEGEVWAKDPDTVDSIAGRLSALWDGKTLPFTGGTVFQADVLTLELDLPDVQLNLTFALLRVQLRVQFS